MVEMAIVEMTGIPFEVAIETIVVVPIATVTTTPPYPPPPPPPAVTVTVPGPESPPEAVTVIVPYETTLLISSGIVLFGATKFVNSTALSQPGCEVMTPTLRFSTQLFMSARSLK